jgi:hypothetical protein
MATNTIRVREKDSLAQFLGWFSIALGSAQLAAPRVMCRLVGARGEGVSPLVMRLVGVRELTQGLGILVRPRPTAWLWSRVGGDALDLSLLGLVAAGKGNKRARTAVAIANVLGVTVPDVFESLYLTKKQGEPRPGMLIRKVVTIRKPRDEVEAAWRAERELRDKVDEAGALVSFAEAPGGRGTELAVEFVHRPRAGDLGTLAARLTGSDLATQLADDLRRLKQQLEVGEVVRSEATPDGHLLSNHLKQRPARPPEEVAR